MQWGTKSTNGGEKEQKESASSFSLTVNDFHSSEHNTRRAERLIEEKLGGVQMCKVPYKFL